MTKSHELRDDGLFLCQQGTRTSHGAKPFLSRCSTNLPDSWQHRWSRSFWGKVITKTPEEVGKHPSHWGIRSRVDDAIHPLHLPIPQSRGGSGPLPPSPLGPAGLGLSPCKLIAPPALGPAGLGGAESPQTSHTSYARTPPPRPGPGRAPANSSHPSAWPRPLRSRPPAHSSHIPPGHAPSG